MIEPKGITNNEPKFNHEFARLLCASLREGAEIISSVHPTEEFQMGDETALVALQDYDSKLDDVVDDEKWEIDLAFKDNKTLFGIESKRGDDLGEDQLKGEWQVLQQNAGKRDVVLLAITNDRVPPPAVQDLDYVDWTSWYDVAARINERFDTPIQYLVTTMIDADRFTGFPDPTDTESILEWQNQFTKMLSDLDREIDTLHLAPKLTMYASVRLSENKSLSDAYQPSPLNLFAPFLANRNRTINKYGRSAILGVHGHFIKDELGVFLNLNAEHDLDGWVESTLRTHGEEIINTAFNNGLILRCSYNSQCNPNHPPRHIRDRHDAIEHIRENLGEGYGKRIMLGNYRSVKKESPSEILKILGQELEDQRDLFFQNGQILGEFREIGQRQD